MTTGKTIALTTQTFVSKVMSLLFNMLSRLVIAFLPINFMAAVTIYSDFGAQENKVCHYFYFFSSICHEVLGPDAMILVFWMLSLSQLFHSPLPLSSRGSLVLLHFLKVVSSAYLRLLIFPLAVLIPACASSSLAFYMMYSAYKLNKQGDNIQPWHTPWLILEVPRL